jgi:urea carboxylase-associated protein 2
MSMTTLTPQAQRQAHRARYEALRAIGEGETSRALPPLTERSHRLNPESILHREEVPAGWYFSLRVERGQALRLINSTGRSTVSLIAWVEGDPSERVNTADTMKVQWSTKLRKGRVIYTDMGRVAFSIIEDTSGQHEALVGPTTRASMESAHGAGAWRNSRDNFLLAAAKFGLSRRDVPACVNFFSSVGLTENGEFTWHPEHRTAGDFVDLRAEMGLWVVISNAGHPLEPEPGTAPGSVELIQFDAPPAGADDICRHACSEAARAFERTERRMSQGSL